MIWMFPTWSNSFKLNHIRLKEKYREGKIAKGPICNMNVGEDTAKYISKLNGQKVYYCREKCKETFEKTLHNMNIR